MTQHIPLGTPAAVSVEAADDGAEGGITVDASCKVGHIVGAFPSGKGSKSTTISRLGAATAAHAVHIGVLSSRDGDAASSMLCMMGVTKVKVCGPVRANDMVYAHTSPGKEGCGTTTAPTAAGVVMVVVGRVLTASAELRAADADDENNVLCAISTGSSDKEVAKVTTAKLRVELKKTIADHVKDNVGGLANGIASLGVAGGEARNAAAAAAAAAAGEAEAKAAAGAPAQIAFQKVNGLDDGAVAVLCSHTSKKMLQVVAAAEDSGRINASGPLTPAAMFVVVSGENEGTVRLQHAEDDSCWLRIGKDGVVDGAGDPDADETLFIVEKNADGSISLKSVAAGKMVAVGEDGVVAAAAADSASADGATFTAYQRMLA